MTYYYVTVTRHIAHTCLSYDQDYFMDSKDAQADFIDRFQGIEDLSLNEITKKGTAQFNKVGVLVKK